MSTIRDVAELAKVSPATVSRVLRDFDSVKEDTRQKVLDAVKALNYQPRIFDKYFQSEETKTIFVLVPDITGFFANVLHGIESIANQYGYTVLLGDTQYDPKREYEYIQLLKQNKTNGIIFLTAQNNRDLIDDLSREYPVVLACEYWEGSKVPTVSIDNVSSARKATEYLIKQGMKRIAHITGPLNLINARDRLKGYKQAMEEYELYDPLLVQIGEGDYSFESGFNLAHKLLALETPPDAVFAANDEIAIGAMQAFKNQSLRIPEDISIIGFNDIKIASVIEPALTTVLQPMYKIGETAMQMMLKIMKKEPLVKRQLILEDELLVRQSTK